MGDLVLSYLDPTDIEALSHASLVIHFSPPMRFNRRRERLQALIREHDRTRGQQNKSMLSPPSRKRRTRPRGFTRSAHTSNTSSSNDENASPTVVASNTEKAKESDETDTSSTDEEEYIPAMQITPAVRQRLLSIIPQDTNRQGIILPEAPNLDRAPTEILLMIYGLLDNIDACCLGLSSPRQYTIYRELFGTKVKLNTRRLGQAGTVERSWEVVGREQCDHCGSYRCQLYRHIEGWMGPNFVSDLVSSKASRA